MNSKWLIYFVIVGVYLTGLIIGSAINHRLYKSIQQHIIVMNPLPNKIRHFLQRSNHHDHFKHTNTSMVLDYCNEKCGTGHKHDVNPKHLPNKQDRIANNYNVSQSMNMIADDDHNRDMFDDYNCCVQFCLSDWLKSNYKK